MVEAYEEGIAFIAYMYKVIRRSDYPSHEHCRTQMVIVSNAMNVADLCYRNRFSRAFSKTGFS